jgi:hypothetical protein
MNKFENYLRKRDPILYEEISQEEKDMETRTSRRGFLGLGALGTMGLLAGYGGRQAKNPSSQEDEDDWDYSDEEEPTTTPSPAPAPQSPTRPSSQPTRSSPQPTRTRKSSDDAEAYLRSLGPVRQILAKNLDNSKYHQMGGTRRGLLSRIFGKKKRR